MHWGKGEHGRGKAQDASWVSSLHPPHGRKRTHEDCSARQRRPTRPSKGPPPTLLFVSSSLIF